ncbi:hypothetical protein [Abditibacterium utsteinense]|uniref:hypothetical protein n=1 Tax=Abditibacterium utsteinense TaxID=1960156 RepID=UPI000D08939F|nr:hypothetical protein [Abditibacterium utsteinense]
MSKFNAYSCTKWRKKVWQPQFFEVYLTASDVKGREVTPADGFLKTLKMRFQKSARSEKGRSRMSSKMFKTH